MANLRVSGLVLGLPLQFCALAGGRPRTATREPERPRAPNQHFWAAPVANLRVSGLVLGLPLQFCALAGRRPRTNEAREHQISTFWAAPVVFLGLPLQFCALAGRRPGTATALLCAHAASAGVAGPRLEPQTFAQKTACLNHCAADSPRVLWRPRLPLQFCALAGRRPRTATGEPASAGPGSSHRQTACLNHCAAGSPGTALLGEAGGHQISTFVNLPVSGLRLRTATGEPERGSRAPNQHFWAAPVANLLASFWASCALAGRRPKTANFCAKELQRYRL